MLRRVNASENAPSGAAAAGCNSMKAKDAAGGGSRSGAAAAGRRGLQDITNKGEKAGAAKDGKKPVGMTLRSGAVASGSAAVRAPAPEDDPELGSPAMQVDPPAASASVSVDADTAPPPARRAKVMPSARAATDIDARDANEPLAVTEYVEGLYDYLRAREVDTRAAPDAIARQPHVNERMRAILVDWLVEVHLKFKLVPDTLYLTVYLIDKYLELATVTRHNLQLVGVTALLLASKYEEIFPPEVRDLVYITDKAYSKEQILDMETTMLNTLGFKLTVPTTYCFLLRYLKAAHADKRIVQLSCYVAERMLQETGMLTFLPSMVASCAIYVARKNLNRNAWSPTLERYTRLREAQLLPCLQQMEAVMRAHSDLTAVQKKFTSHKFGTVATMDIEVLP